MRDFTTRRDGHDSLEKVLSKRGRCKRICFSKSPPSPRQCLRISGLAMFSQGPLTLTLYFTCLSYEPLRPLLVDDPSACLTETNCHSNSPPRFASSYEIAFDHLMISPLSAVLCS